jgi:4-amino-4-deoxy-L-arabinose transferase-like glycosyltransferase
MYARRTARLALLLLCASPWFVLMSMNFMTHTFTLFAALIAAVATARARRTGRLAWAVPAGIALGVMALIRPLEALTVAVLLGLWAMVRPGGGLRLATPALMAALSALTAAITLPYNRMLSGAATVFPLMAYTDAQYGAGTNALGFGANRGLGWPGLDPLPGHGPLDVLINANQNIYSVNVELLGWGAGSLLLIALLVFSGAMRRSDRMMLAMIAAIIGIHSVYWFSGGPDFGARYWYMILVPCIALSARGLEVLAERLSEGRGGRPEATDPHTRALLGGAALAVIAVLVFVPWRGIDKYYHYRGMRPDVRRIASASDFGRDLVLVRGRRFPDYASAAPYNPIDLNGDAAIYVWDRSADVRMEALRAYPDRRVWIVDGPAETGAGYRLVAGPLRADSMIAAGAER